MVNIGLGANRKQSDYKLLRYACYLIAQNEVGSKISQTIKELGGTMSKELPTPKKS